MGRQAPGRRPARRDLRRPIIACHKSDLGVGADSSALGCADADGKSLPVPYTDLISHGFAPIPPVDQGGPGGIYREGTACPQRSPEHALGYVRPSEVRTPCHVYDIMRSHREALGAGAVARTVARYQRIRVHGHCWRSTHRGRVPGVKDHHPASATSHRQPGRISPAARAAGGDRGWPSQTAGAGAFSGDSCGSPPSHCSSARSGQL